MAVATAALAFYLVGCFGFAAGAKLRDLAGFAATVREIVPPRIAPPAAAMVIAAEIAVALLLAGGLAAGSLALGRAGAFVALAAAAAFAVAIATVLVRGRHVACNCFGADEGLITPASFAGPAMVAVAALIASRADAWPGTPGAWIASGAAGAGLVLAHRLLPRLLASAWHRRPADLMLPAGFEIQSFAGMPRHGEPIEIGPGDATAYALVFLSEGCPKCRPAAPAVAEAAARADEHGVSLWVVTADRLTATSLGQDDGFEAHFLDVPPASHAMLNPRSASPAYLFVGADLVVQAGGIIGDADWLSFVEQIGEPA